MGTNWREKYRVRIGFAFGALFLWRAQPRFLPFLALGLAIALIGVLIRQWAAGCIRKNDALATGGPYALVRNPLYFGSFLAAAGFVLAATSFPIAIAKPHFDRSLLFWCFLWILVDSIYLPKIADEEKKLRSLFGAAYDAYAEKVPALFPRAGAWSSLNFQGFDWKQWARNREYGSLAGYAILCVVLIARYLYRR